MYEIDSECDNISLDHGDLKCCDSDDFTSDSVVLYIMVIEMTSIGSLFIPRDFVESIMLVLSLNLSF